MGKEQGNLIPDRLDWKRNLAIALWLAASAGAGAGVGVAAFHGLWEQEPAIEEETQSFRLVPTYTPTPKIEISPTLQPEPTPIPKIVIVLEPPNTSEVNPVIEKKILHDLFQQYPEVWGELPLRAEKVIDYVESKKQNEFLVYRDYKIFEKYGKDKRGLSLSKENLMFILAWYELEYAQPIEQNPNFQRGIKELESAIRVVNQIMKEKLSAEEFIGKEIPQLPDNPQQSLIFSNVLGGGHFIAEIHVIEEMRDPNPENYQYLLEYFVGVVPHELIHAWPQALFVGQSSSWSHEVNYEIKIGDTLWEIAQKSGLKVADILKLNPQIENPDLIFPDDSLQIPQKGESIFPENRKYHLAHMSMCSLTAPAQEKLGFKPGIEPRIIYIYSRLRENGVEDPYGLIVEAGATMNSDKLWEVYEGARKPGDLSLDELISSNDPGPDFEYYTLEELKAFRAEYASYLS